MYALYKQNHPPSGVEHCVYCNFYSSKESNLVVVGTTHLRIYKLYDQTEKSSTDEKVSDASSKKKKLELVGQYSVFGNIETLQAVRLAGNTRDSLLLSFQAAKLAIIEYDPTTHDIKTRSLHFFEDEKIKTTSIVQDRPPIVRIDPERRCAVMLIYGTHLVVLPFRQEGGLDEHDLDSGTAGSDRSPVLPSYIINTKELDEKTCNIVDLQFLHGYYEPTLLILYEPIKTWAGRLAMRRDTCALVAISLNMSEKVHPVIWQLGNLPFDCYSVLAVPKPISGVLVFTTNSLLYLNQSVPPYGVSLNSIAESSTSFPLKPQESVTISLENAHAIFISNDKFVVSLKGGEIYVVTLVADGVRSVRSFNFDKAAASVLTSCICECSDGYLFLGSRLGNSLLVKYTEKPQDLGDLFSPAVDPPNAKRRRMDSDFTYAIDDIDEVEVYGHHEEAGVELTSYTFEVCDSLLNIGPCTCLDMGEPGFLSEEFSESLDPDVELVSCSGYGKNGALTVLQRTVRPQVVTTFELPGCTDMWTVLSQNTHNKEDQTTEDAKMHSFLILSRQDSSMVLKTEQEIMELDNSGFTTQHPTIFAGNLGNGSHILQITPMGIRLLEGVNQVQHIPMDSGLSSIVWCSVADPYVILMTADGSVVFLEFIVDANGPSLTVSRPPVNQGSKICACCTYKDVSGLLTTEKSNTTEASKPSPQSQPVQKTKIDIDEEDEMLYGDSSIVFGTEPEQPSKPTNKGDPKVEVNDEPVKTTYWCVLCRQNGVMEIYSIPDFKLVFYVKNFNMAPKVLVDSGDPGQGASVSSVRDEESIAVKEILLTGLGYKKRRVTMVALVDQDLLIYEAFPFSETAVERHLNLRFKRVQHSVLVREKKAKTSKNKLDNEQEQTKVASLRVFDDISSYAGIFVCGSFPHWIFVTNRGALRCHPMSIDGPVTCFAAFHNVNCPKGFLYFNTKGELRISVLPTHLSYDSPWPVRKVPLRCTPHMVAYNRESKTYAIVTSEQEPCKHIPRVTAEDKEFLDANRDSRFIYPVMDKFTIQLMSPLSWEIIPNTRHDLEEWEHVTAMKNLMLHSQETHTGRKGFICVGTTMLYGEEFASRGRILIFDIIEVVPEPGQPLTKNKFKLLYDKEQKGPITALNQVNGYLVSGIGQKIYIWNFENNDLIGMAFIDTQLYIHSLVTIRNFVLAADLTKSITLLRLQEETKTLAFVSRDPHNVEVYGTEFVIDGTQMGFLVSDVDQNLILFTYQPEAIESAGGQRLLQRADINIGSHVTSLFRVRAKSVEKPGGEKAKDLRQLTYFGTLDGGLGFLLPMTEKTYRRLHMLQTKLVDCIPHVAGLNPKAFRILQSKGRVLNNPHRNVLDWELLSKFIHLGFMERQEVAKKIGTTPSQILDDMMDVERACDRF